MKISNDILDKPKETNPFITGKITDEQAHSFALKFTLVFVFLYAMYHGQ